MSSATTKVSIIDAQGVVVCQYHLGDGEHLIGRGAQCAIQIDGDGVSRQHARLILTGDTIEIEDLESTSGTTVEGAPVQSRMGLQLHQRLWVSNYHVVLERLGFSGLMEGSRMGAGRFVLKLELGKGGMGAVWLAFDEVEQADVALKVFTDERAGMDAEGLNDLKREVEKTQCLQHPHIVRMGQFWNEEGEPPFISMEYVAGTDLHELKRSAAGSILSWDKVRAYMMQLCDALNFAHSQRLAHRDIKPSNFLIDHEGNLKLTDFGISASLANSALSVTAPSLMGSGTPQYMSPQQMDGNPPNVTDDIYSVGATFYDLLTSKPPFYQGELSYQIRHADPVPISQRLQELGLQNEIPDYIEAIVMACLQKDPGQRPQSMEIIRYWIESAEAGVEADPDAPHGTELSPAQTGWDEAEPDGELKVVWPPRNEAAQAEVEQPRNGWMGVGIAAGVALLVWLVAGLADIKPIYAGMSPLVAGFGGEEPEVPAGPVRLAPPPDEPSQNELEQLWLTNATRLVENRSAWVGVMEEIQQVCTRLEPEVHVLVDPDEMVPFTNELGRLLEQYTTPPLSVTNVQTALWIRSLQTVASDEGALDTLRLKVRARNIQPRLRPSLNREFAALVLEEFRKSPRFAEAEEETKLAGAVPTPDPTEPWFDFELQLKLAQPLLQAGHSLELGEYQPHLGQSLAAPYPGQQGGNGFFNRLFPAVVKLNQEATNNQVNLPEDYSKIGGNGFSFSFAPILESAAVPTNRLMHLQAQLEDVEHMARVLRESGVLSIEALQRAKVCPEDHVYANTGLKPELIFHDQENITNAVGVVYPYRIKLRSLSTGVAKVVSALSTHSACVIRKIHLTPSTKLPEKPTSGGFYFPNGLPPEYAQSLAQLSLTTLNVRTLVQEGPLEVTIDLDYSRQQGEPPTETPPEPLQAVLQNEPPPWSIAVTNHLVFNPRVWKEIHHVNRPLPRLQADSADEPLGISALKVTAIRTNYATLSGRTYLNGATIRHEFMMDDADHLVKPYGTQSQAPLATFLPQAPMPSQYGLTRANGWMPAPQTVRPLHQFIGVGASWLAYQPDWEMKAVFQAVSMPGQAQLTQARLNPSGQINGMTYDLDLITRNQSETNYATNRVRIQSSQPYKFARSFEADFRHQTPHQTPVNLKQFREGRRLLIDGEVFQVRLITGDEVTLVSDLTCGGTGKEYRKTFVPDPVTNGTTPRPRPD